MASLSKSLGPGSPLFVVSHGVALFKSYLISNVKILVAMLGLDPSKFAGHSFRAGAASSAALSGLKEWELQSFGRWKSNVFNIYIRKPELVADFAQRIALHYSK